MPSRTASQGPAGPVTWTGAVMRSRCAASHRGSSIGIGIGIALSWQVFPLAAAVTWRCHARRRGSRNPRSPLEKRHRQPCGTIGAGSRGPVPAAADGSATAPAGQGFPPGAPPPAGSSPGHRRERPGRRAEHPGTRAEARPAESAGGRRGARGGVPQARGRGPVRGAGPGEGGHPRGPGVFLLRPRSTTPVGAASTLTGARGGVLMTGARMTLVGRDTVIGALDAALAECAEGGARIVLAEGATGCGKSTLADVAAERARAAGALVLTAVAAPEERHVALGVLRQLAHGEAGFALPLPGPPPGADGTGGAAPARVEAMQGFCARLRELSAERPVVLVVDDVQHADGASLQYLQYLARHARTAAVLTVLTGTPHAEELDPVFTTELMRQPHFTRLRLDRLSPAEVATVLAALRPRPGGGDRLALPVGDLHRISGGNPLLLRALVEETGSGRPPAPEVGGPYAQAVTTCLHRTGPTALAAARAAAVLGERSTPERVVRLLGNAAAATRRALAALEAAGLLETGGRADGDGRTDGGGSTDGALFRHPAAPAAVLEDTAPGVRADLHRRAARLLREDGAPATTVAGHLSAASAEPGAEPGPADVEVLLEAAEERLAQGDARLATRLLELALRAAADPHARHGIRLRLAQAAARFDPAAAERRLTALVEAHPGAAPNTEHTRSLVGLLCAQGRIGEAAVLDTSGPAPGGTPPGGAAPGSAAAAFGSDLDTPGAVSERLLQGSRLAEATVAPLAQALRSLTASDQPDRAVRWSRRLLEEAGRADAPGWVSLFGTLHAEALLRLGDLTGAHAQATAALQALPDRTGSAFHCAPTAVLIRACSAMGRFTEASRLADRQLPPRLPASLHGLAYLRARGLHRLAVNQPHAALADFLETGRLMADWGIDRPAHLPWRTDAAGALLLLGEARQAEQLVLDQLAHPDARRPWVRGLSLRLRALTGEPRRRGALLGQAVEELHRSGDRVETARAMADLGRALQHEGSPKGNTMIRNAWNLAKDSEAVALCREILPDAPLTPPVRDRAQTGGQTAASGAKLSGSEQRVATLAAQGLTNREISAKLFLTVSTVEQHLTRVYRKLRITSRGDLPMDLTPVTRSAV
ncbi:helix-turn-helix transcriptional regulator [Streptomyces vinaceus]|uniref:helix-turn-helix transcriptional regulator n=1 Tax=Streptomyces vinaceus TaxID=1960 RepID=UPI003821EFEE